MRIIITKIEFGKDKIIVDCRTDIGELKGIWVNSDNPIVGKPYHVELTLEELSRTPKKQAIHEYQVLLNGQDVYFKGICEGSDEEVLYIRFSHDWIEMIDDTDEINIGEFVCFSVNYKDIKIYPYEL